jgi:hypothetical protein
MKKLAGWLNLAVVPYLIVLSLVQAEPVMKAHVQGCPDHIAAGADCGPPILAVVLFFGTEVPKGWVDTVTRPDATVICRNLLATQSSSSHARRCIAQVEPDR